MDRRFKTGRLAGPAALSVQFRWKVEISTQRAQGAAFAKVEHGRNDARALSQRQFGVRPESADRSCGKRPEGHRAFADLAGRPERSGLYEAQSQRRRADAGARRQRHRRVFADPLLHRRSIPGPAADADDAGRPAPRPPLQQADRRIHAQCVHDHDICDGIPSAFSQNDARCMAGRDQQGAAEAPSRIQTQRHRAWSRFGIRHRCAAPAPENDFVDGRRSQARPLSCRRSLQQRRLRGDPVHPEA